MLVKSSGLLFLLTEFGRFLNFLITFFVMSWHSGIQAHSTGLIYQKQIRRHGSLIRLIFSGGLFLLEYYGVALDFCSSCRKDNLPFPLFWECHGLHWKFGQPFFFFFFLEICREIWLFVCWKYSGCYQGIWILVDEWVG